MLTVLARRDFALLWTAGLISNLGSWATFVSIPVLVFQQTRSPLAAAAVFTFTVVPMLLTSVAGVFVDRWDRRRILIVTNLLQAAVTAPLVLMPHGHLWLVYAAMFGLALIGNFSAPAENSLLPTLADTDQLPSANALNALNDNIGRIAGPAVGAAVLALGGFTTVIMLDVATFAVASALVAAIRTRSPSPVGPAPPRHRHAHRHRIDGAGDQSVGPGSRSPSRQRSPKVQPGGGRSRVRRCWLPSCRP